MRRALVAVAAVLGLGVATAGAQDVDPRAALQASLKAMGEVKTVQYSGAGFSSLVGQQFSVTVGWPSIEVANYTRSIDYDARWSREDYVRRQGNYPTFGRPPMADQPVTAIVSGAYAWDLRNGQPATLDRYLYGIPYSELRQLEVAITPHGFLKAALAAKDAKAIRIQYLGASDFGLSQYGRWVTIVTFTYLGKYRINGTIDDQNLVELVDTWIANPIYGDMNYELRYTQYKDFNGVKFPMLWHTHQADPRLNVSHNYYEYRITDVTINQPVATLPVPDVVRNAVLAKPKVESQRLAQGVWLLGGGSHNSLLVEFRDYLAVVDTPNNEERSLAVIEEAARLVPGKPIQYAINTHHHFDHLGGLRTYLSQGTTIVTHESNKEYYIDILFSPFPRTLEPDRMAFYNPMYWISRRPPQIETVAGEARGSAKYVVTDGERILEILKVQDVAYELGDRSYAQGNHSEDMLIAYLP
ncbi:MAG: MBL fold metallo-hydrolase, partial [Vicinamibacterales bacterium]